jgi:hypothetical protein
MGIAHHAVGVHRCTFEVWDGDIDEEEVRSHLVRLAEDPDWPPGPLNLVDLSTMGEVTVPDPDLVALLREGTILETELKTALIVRADLYDAASQYEESAQATGVRAFRDVQSASEHIEIPFETSVSQIERLRQSLQR